MFRLTRTILLSLATTILSPVSLASEVSSEPANFVDYCNNGFGSENYEDERYTLKSMMG